MIGTHPNDRSPPAMSVHDSRPHSDRRISPIFLALLAGRLQIRPARVPLHAAADRAQVHQPGDLAHHHADPVLPGVPHQ